VKVDRVQPLVPKGRDGLSRFSVVRGRVHIVAETGLASCKPPPLGLALLAASFPEL
jgi:hypothetical protein